MAKRIGKCMNFGLCAKADSRANIEAGDGAEFSCPECGKPLTGALVAEKGAAAKSGPKHRPAKSTKRKKRS